MLKIEIFEQRELSKFLLILNENVYVEFLCCGVIYERFVYKRSAFESNIASKFSAKIILAKFFNFFKFSSKSKCGHCDGHLKGAKISRILVPNFQNSAYATLGRERELFRLKNELEKLKDYLKALDRQEKEERKDFVNIYGPLKEIDFRKFLRRRLAGKNTESPCSSVSSISGRTDGPTTDSIFFFEKPDIIRTDDRITTVRIQTDRHWTIRKF